MAQKIYLAITPDQGDLTLAPEKIKQYITSLPAASYCDEAREVELFGKGKTALKFWRAGMGD